MGLSSWIQNVLAGKKGQKTRSAREEFVHLFLTRLEDRRVLNADFSLVGDSLALNNFTQTADENLTIQDTGTQYQFILSEGLWNGTDSAGVVTGAGTGTLTVDKTTVNNSIQIEDSAAIDVDIQFGAGADTVDFTPLTSGLDIIGAGGISQGVGTTLIVPTFDVDASNITLDEATNNFGTIGLSGNTASITDANSLILGDVALASSFTLDVTSGDSTQALGTGITGTASLTKEGAGRLILSEINTYTGTTEITQGEVQVNGEIGNGGPAGTVTVRGGATLSGSGTINADVVGETGSSITATGSGFTLGNANSTTGFVTTGTLTVGTFTVNVNDQDSAALGTLTTINGGTLNAANGLTAGNGDTIQGQGTVATGTASLTIQSGGTLSPGNSPGIINTNNLVLESGSIYVVELNSPYTTAGVDYDQTNVTGTVSLNGATLMLQGGAVAPATGASLIIIQNDGTDAITGTFSGLAQGATVTVGSFTGQINYFGGDGNDVTLEVASALTYTNTGGGALTVRQNTTNGTIEIVKGGTVVGSQLAGSVTEIIINGDPDFTDTLTVDYAFGGFFTQKVTFGGGEDALNADNDTLIVTGGTFGLAVHTFTGPDAGTILYDVDGDTGTTTDQATIAYTGLEPVDMTGSTITDLVFNLPAGDDQAILEGDGTSGNGILQIRSLNGTFETTTFTNPAGSLTINLGGGNDTLTLDGSLTVDDLTDFTASLTIDGQAGTDSVTFQGNLNLGSPTHAGNLNVTADNITLNNDANIVTTAGTVGDVTLTAGQDITMQDGSTITTLGNATLIAGNNVQLSRIVVGGTNAAMITAGNAITDANTTNEGGGNENIVANNILLQAVNGIGNGTGVLDEGQDIDIDGVTLSATNTIAGAIQIFDVNDLALGQIANTARPVVIDVGGAITDADTALEGAGNENIIAGMIVLRAVTGIGSGTGVLGEGEDIDINGGTLSANNTTSGTVQIFEVDNIALGRVENAGRTVVIEAGGAIADADITLEGATNENIVANNILLQAANGIGNGTGTFGEGEDIDINGGTLFANNTTAGAIQIFEVDSIAVDQIINLTRTVILDAGQSITDSTPAIDGNITAGQAGLRATAGIDMDTNVSTLAAQTTTGDITIDETDGLTIATVGGLAGVSITAGGVDDDITIAAGGMLTINNAVQNGTGDIMLTVPGNDLVINADVTTAAPGNITLNGQNVQITSATVEVTGDGTILTTTPRNGLITGTGLITINAPGTTTLNTNATVRTGGGVIQLTTDDIVIDPTASIASNQVNGGVVIIRNASADRNIALGGTLAGTLNLTDAELDTITAAALRIGRRDGVANAGDISITADFSASLAALPTVQLFANGDVANAGGGLIAGNIGIDVGGFVQMGSSANDAINTLAILSDGVPTLPNQGVLFVDANSLTIGQIADDVDNALPADGEAGKSGVTSTNSFVDLRAMNGNLTVPDIATDPTEIFAGGSNSVNNLAINLLAAAAETFITINAGANITSTAGHHRYTADNMDIDGTITASATDFSVNLRNANAGVAIDLGSLDDADPNVLELSDAELDNITTHLLAIGRNTGNATGNITITAAISPANTSTLHLITPDTVTDAVGGAIVETNLLIEADNGAILDIIGSHDVDVLAAVVTTPGADFTFRDVDDLVVGTVDQLTVTNDALELANLAAVSGITTQGRDLMDLGGNVLVISETGELRVDADITTTGTTATGNGMGGDITLLALAGNVNINTGNLIATGEAGAFDGGDVLVDANGDSGDVIITGNIITNDIDDGTVRGNVTVTADDSVTISGDISTSGLGIVSITSNVSANDGDNDGLLTMNPGASITAENGSVTLQTIADSFDNASITVEQITTADGVVLIDANGQNADVTLRNTITTANADVTILADDSVAFLSTGMILTGAGNVLVQANESATDGDGNDELSMADGSVINAGTGTITLLTTGTNGGNITLGLLQTTNNTTSSVNITSNSAVLDTDDSAGLDIIATAAGSQVNITASTGIGNGLGNAIETSAVRFNVLNSGAADVNLVNTTANLDVENQQLATRGGNINFINNSGTGLLTIEGLGVTSGDTNPMTPVNGGNITIATDADLKVTALLSSRRGRGGAFTLTGGGAFDDGAMIQLGTGNITVTTGSQDIFINTSLMIDNGPATFQAPRDIIVGDIDPMVDLPELLLSRVDDGTGTDTFEDATMVAVQNGSPIDSHITLIADFDQNNVGGTLVRSAAQIVASGNLTIKGSDVFNDALLVAALDPSIQNGVHIETAGALQPRLLAAGNLTLQNQSGLATADVVIGGSFGTQNATTPAGPGLDILIDANENIHLTDDTTISTPANITFGDIGLPRQDAIIDDLDNTTASSLTINSDGVVTIFGGIGDNLDGIPNLQERIDSLTITKLTPAGTPGTILMGGVVNTVNDQTYETALFLDATTEKADSTSFIAGGNVTFDGVVRGFDSNPSALNTPIEDDVVLNVTGTTTFAGQVGVNPTDPSTDPTQRIGDGTGPAITINSAGATEFQGEAFTQSGFLQAETAGRITFRENVSVGLGDTGNLFLADVTLDGLVFQSEVDVTFGSPTPNEDELLIMAPSGIGAANRNIILNSQVIDPVGPANQSLALNLGLGDLFINGNVGTGGNRFGALVIDTARNVTLAGGATITSESVTERNGSGDTILNGAINTSLPEGVTLASTNFVYNGLVITNGGRVLTNASGNITYSAASTTVTAGGMVVSDAAGAIIMAPSGLVTIDAGGGQVVMEAGGNIEIGRILSAGGFVSLTSTLGSLIDVSDSFGPDIQSAQLRLQAATGIGGAGNYLDTAVSNLDALNTGAGSVLVANTGDLTIGGLPGVTVSTIRNDLLLSIALPPIAGVINANGLISLVNNGNLLELPNTTIQATNGNVELTLLTGNATFQGQINTIGNNDIIVTTPGTFTLENVMGTVGGTITSGGGVELDSDGNWTAGGNTIITAATGSVELTVGGNANLLGQVITQSDSPIFADVTGTFTLGGVINSGGDIGLRSDADWTALPETTILANNGTVAIGVVGDALFQGQVAAMNGNHIFVDVTGDFTLVNGTQSADFLVTGNGQIVVTADGSVNLIGTPSVVSGTGIVMQATPFVPLQLISTPQIGIDGIANLTFSVGLPGETNFTFIVDWGDGTTDVRTVNAGTHTISHLFENPPDPANPGANIRVFLVVVNDPHIHFFGNNNSLLPVSPLQPPPNPALPQPSGPLAIGSLLFPNQLSPLTINQFVLNAISPVNFNTRDLSISNAFELVQEALNSVANPNLAFPPFAMDITNLGIVTAVPAFAVPISGFGGVSVIEPVEALAFFVPGGSVQPLPDEDTDFNQDSEDIDFSGSDAEEEGQDEVQVRLRVLSPAGQVLFEYDIEARYLSNPDPLWARLSDGRYQIVIVEPGSTVPLVVRDVQLKDNKVIRRFDRTRRGADDETSQLENPANVVPASWEAPVQESFEEPAAIHPDGVWENWQPPQPARRLSRSIPEPQGNSEETPAAMTAAFAGTLAFTALRRHTAQDAESSVMQFSPRALSPAARLRRRLRR